jgi:serine phosphatase RsbU (regulator of sigma subunit)/ligand-binding sensor domain-containing protein
MKWNKNIFNLKFFIISFLLLLISNINAQEKYFFEKLSVSDGLSNSVVLCTFQDHLGFLWIGTLDGLDRYDGYDIKVYKNIPSDSNSLPFNIINSIGEDREGNLLVGTTDQVSKYNRATDNFESIPIDKRQQSNFSKILTFVPDSKGRLWITTDYTGILLFDKSINKFRGINVRDYSGNLISLSVQKIFWNVTELENGNILAASETHGVFIFNLLNNEFQPYFPDPKLNIKNINQIFEDSSGKILFGGKDEIYIYNPVTYDLKSINMKDRFPKQGSNNYYGKFYEESSKQIIMACDFGIIEADFSKNEFLLITENIPNLTPTNFYKDNFGIYWISTAGNGLIRFDPAKKPFRFFNINNVGQSETKSNPVTSVVQNPIRKNNLILSLQTRGLFTFDRGTNKFSKIQNQDGINLLPDDKGNIWYTIDDKLNKLDLKSGTVESFTFENISFSQGSDVYKLTLSPDKNIWISSIQGVQIFNPITKSFSRVPSITNKPVSTELMSKIRNIVNNETPIASILKVGETASLKKEFNLEKSLKVLIINLGEGRLYDLTANMFDYGWLEDSNGKKIWEADSVQNSFNDGGGFKNRIAFGCLDLPKGKYKINFVSDVGNSYGAFNVTAPPDSVWYGIQVIQLNDQQYSYLNEKIKSESDNTHCPPFEIVIDIVFSRKYINTAWLATYGMGLIRLNIKDNTWKHYTFDDRLQRFPLKNRLYGILEDNDGILWCSTYGGLIRFNPETEDFRIITQSDGLASSLVTFMLQDKTGNLWFGTPGGISMLDKRSSGNQLSFINYDNKDGINDLPLNNSIAMSNDGEIFYGGYGGLDAFYPGSANSTLPKPVIISLNISGVPVEKMAYEVNLKTDISEIKELELPFADNNISFEFASIHFSRPAKNKLAYMLQGIDKDWNYTNRRFASYLNLPPGEYTFRLKGSNGDGIWNPKEASIKIIINPPWYRTVFAYIGYGFLFIGLIFGIDRVQRRRLLNKARNTAAIKEAQLRAQLAETENERKTKELEEARQLQLSMLPKKLPQLPHLDIAVYMKTATEVGGDYYDFNVALDGTLTIVLGDATGHGMRAGTMVTSAKTLFNSYAANPDILFTFFEMTRCIKQMQFQSLAMSMTMLKIKNNKLLMSAAGMPPVYIFRRENRVIEEHLLKGMPLGTMDDFPYELRELNLFKGDTLLLMSDGFLELQSDKNEIFGYRRAKNSFEEVAEKEPEEIISYLKEEGSRWSNDKEPDDDITFVVIKVK